MKNTQKVWFVAQEWNSNKNAQYHESQIQIIIRDDQEIPYFGASTMARLIYQRNTSDTGDQLKYYGEHMEMNHPDIISLGIISALFAKMGKYSDKIYDQGLTLNVCPIGDEYFQRIALLKAIGATRLYYNPTSKEYTDYPVCA